MATKYQNLSEYDANTLPERHILETQKYAIVVSDWNSEITHVLCDGAYDTFIKQGVRAEHIDVYHVPGAFELTYAASLLKNGETTYDAIIVLGCVIKGDTPHFDYVCLGVTQGITQLNLQSESCPVIFGLLTTNSLEQAKERSGGKYGNKGIEAATTAIKMANIFL